jgi:asparagine N-glycosylation enzyme membrane subunit Stt3
MDKDGVMKILKDKRFQWAVAGIILLFVLFSTSSIRLSNWDLLTDQTTGEKIPLALDPFYFLRLSETIVEQGGLPEVDVMRYPSANAEYSPEILPQAVVGMYRIGNLFGDYTLREVNVFSPVAFYFVGLILFFFLIYVLTKSKTIAVISSIFLAYAPSYLYRTMAGFSDHEAIGMVALFAAMLVFSLALKWIDKNKGLLGAGLFGLGAAFLSTLTIASWGGVAKLLFMIFALGFLVFWLFKIREDKGFIKRGLLFYTTWVLFSFLFGPILGYGAKYIFDVYMLSSAGLISLFVLGFIFVDSGLLLWGNKFSFIKKKYRVAYSFAGIFALGIVGLAALGKSIISVLAEVWLSVFHPWGVGRVGLTVAENSQPYLLDWIAQSGNVIFWMAFMGILFVGWEFARDIKNMKRRILTVLFWIVMVCSSLFSRISPTSIMNGTNFISQVVYAGGLFLALGFLLWLYFNEKFSVKSEILFIVAWTFVVLLSGRAAQRIFFAIAPFMSFMAAYFIIKLFHYAKENKEEILKIILVLAIIVSVFLAARSVYDFDNSIRIQASQQGPSAHYQWQATMSWVRDNTAEKSIFMHWWDYGYWVETLGERRTLTDGGHVVTHWDHFIGRYVLTTPYPETAYSFMKTHEVTHLLIDPTDLGKYGAYSKIGSGEDGMDRYAAIPVIPLDSRQTVESADSITMVYSGGMTLFEDIEYTTETGTIFLPAGKAGLGGIILSLNNVDNMASIVQPIGVYFYNNQRYDIPIRYAQTAEGLVDFGGGLDAVIKIIPSFDGRNINQFGAAIYLSPKVSRGLFAQLYLLDDAFGKYGDMKIAHKQDDGLVASIKSQGGVVGDFIYYGGFRGPIKIWDISYPEGTLAREEFLRWSGAWAEFDDLEFTE